MGKFVMKTTKNGKIKFDLKASNGQIVATSQSYKAAKYARTGINSVIKNAPGAAVEDQTVEGYTREKHPKFEIYKDNAGEFRFRLKAANGQIIAVSEGYTTMKACVNGVNSVKKNAVDAPIVEE